MIILFFRLSDEKYEHIATFTVVFGTVLKQKINKMYKKESLYTRSSFFFLKTRVWNRRIILTKCEENAFGEEARVMELVLK